MKKSIWIVALACTICLMSFSGCDNSEAVSSTQENSIPGNEASTEMKLLLRDENYDVDVYGITEDGEERIHILYGDEKIEIEFPFSNIYEEMPHLCVNDIDNDSFDEVILAIRRETGTKRTYDFYICDKIEDWKTTLYEVTQEEILTMISYEYSESANTILFAETGGEGVEILLPEWSTEYPFTGDVSFADEYFYDVSAMTLEIIAQIRMTDSLPYKPLGIVFDVRYKDGAISLEFRCFERLINETTKEEVQENQPGESYITSITPIDDDRMEVTFAYEINGEIKEHSLTSVRMPDLGLEPRDRARVELIDIDGDGASEVVCKVYYIGNTFTELCGDLYVYRVSEDGLEPVLSLGTDYGVPDERWITATYSTDTALYVETGSKRWEDGELYTDPIVYKAEYRDGAWITTGCELPEVDNLKCW